MKGQSVVFYGAGEHAALIFNSALKKIAPRKAVAFVDSDVYKQGGTYLGLPVLSWEAATKRYDDIYIYITANAIITPRIIGYLIENGVAPERSINYEPVEYRLGCEQVEALVSLTTRYESIVFHSCCILQSSGFTSYSQIPQWKLNGHKVSAKSFENMYQSLNKMAESIKNKVIPDACKHCETIREQYFFSNRKIRRISLGGDAPCNYRCLDCVLGHNDRYLGKEPYTELLKSLRTLEEFYGYDENIPIILSCGEFSFNNDASALLHHLKKYNCAYFTNAFMFNEAAAEALQNGRGYIYVSVDAGTRETYYAIKGIDAFEGVCRNLYEYAKLGPVVLKYIVFEGINDNDADLEGFFQLADAIAIRVVLMRNLFKGKDQLSENTLQKCAKFIMHFRETKKMGSLMGFELEGKRLSKILKEYGQ